MEQKSKCLFHNLQIAFLHQVSCVSIIFICLSLLTGCENSKFAATNDMSVSHGANTLTLLMCFTLGPHPAADYSPALDGWGWQTNELSEAFYRWVWWLTDTWPQNKTYRDGLWHLKESITQENTRKSHQVRTGPQVRPKRRMTQTRQHLKHVHQTSCGWHPHDEHQATE